MQVKLVDWHHLGPGSERVAIASRFDGTEIAFGVHRPLPAHGEGVPAGLRNRIDRFAALALLAVDPLQRRLPADVAPDRIGLYVANVYAGWSYGEAQLAHLVDEGPSAVHAFQATAWFPAAAQGELSIAHGWTGPAKTFSGSDCAFAEALLCAVTHLNLARIDVAFVGLAESLTSDFVTWGAGLRDVAADCAEDALFLMLSTREATEGTPFHVDVLHGATAPSPPDAEPALAPPAVPSRWAPLLARSITLMRDGGAVDAIRLPLSEGSCLRLGRRALAR